MMILTKIVFVLCVAIGSKETRENALQSVSSRREQLKKWVGVRDHLQATDIPKGNKVLR